jgi:hypothetical protein
MFSIILALLASVPASVAIEAIREKPEAYRDQRVKVCGELSVDNDILYSDVFIPRHGRVGIRIRGFTIPREHIDVCLEGQWVRDPKLPYANADHIIFTDASVHPSYVLIPQK